MHSHGSIVATVFGFIIIWVVLLDAFETVVLPRRVTRHFKLTAWFYRRTWIPWRGVARRIKTSSRQQNFLGYFGPLSLILLLAFWAAGLIFGFALVQYGIGGHEQLNQEPLTFGRILYHSGETFFTLGYGDIVPTSGGARALSVIEAGMGFAFLGRGDWIYPRGICVVLAARDSDLHAGCARGIASFRGGVAVALGREVGRSGSGSESSG